MPRPLAALLAVAGITVLAWTLVTPALQGPDELSHFSYTQRLVEDRSLPQDIERGQYYSTEAAVAADESGLGALPGNLGARPDWTGLAEGIWRRADARLPAAAQRNGLGLNPANNNGPVYYLYESVPYAVAGGSFFDRQWAMRAWNIPLHLATVALTWMIAGLLLGGALWIRTLATAMVALHPQLAHMAGVVNPDVLLTATWTAFIYLAVLLLKRGPTPWRVTGIGALCATAALTHPRGLPMLAGAAAAVALSWWRFRPERRRALLWTAGAVAAVAIPAGIWLALVSSVGGDVERGAVTGETATPFMIREFFSYVWQFYLPRPPFMTEFVAPGGVEVAFGEQFFAAFANQEVRFADGVYDVLKALTALGLVGLAAALVVRRREVAPRWDVLAVLAILIVALLGAAHYTAYHQLLIDRDNSVITGRYLFPLISLFGVAVAFAVSSLPRRFQAPAAALLVGSGALLSLAGLGLTVTRFHA